MKQNLWSGTIRPFRSMWSSLLEEGPQHELSQQSHLHSFLGKQNIAKPNRNTCMRYSYDCFKTLYEAYTLRCASHPTPQVLFVKAYASRLGVKMSEVCTRSSSIL